MKETQHPDGTVTHESDFSAVDGRTNVPSPSAMSALQYYCRPGGYLEYHFGVGISRLNQLNQDYKILMPSKNGKSREQYVQVATASALSPDSRDKNVIKKLQES